MLPDVKENRAPASVRTLDHRERKKTPAGCDGSHIKPAGAAPQQDTPALTLNY